MTMCYYKFFCSLLHHNRHHHHHQHQDVFTEWSYLVLSYYPSLSSISPGRSPQISPWTVEYTGCFFVERYELKLNECPAMTLKNRTVSLQYCWNFGECGVPLNCYCSQVQSVLQLRVGLSIWFKLFDISTVCKQITYAKLNCLK